MPLRSGVSSQPSAPRMLRASAGIELAFSLTSTEEMLSMRILECIEDQITSTHLPLVGITLAAVPCPDTPVILTLHWHGFIKEKLAEIEEAQTVSYTPIPSSALQLNDRWNNLVAVDRAAMEAAWELGAWDVSRAERPGCMRPGAACTEALECLQAFGSFPYGINGSQVVVSDAPDADDLVHLAA